MTDFLTRVELHDAVPADYDALDAAMLGSNFAKTIRSGHGFEYRMPSATYFSSADQMSAADVRNLAMAAARCTGRRYDIVTTSGEMSYFLHPNG